MNSAVVLGGIVGGLGVLAWPLSYAIGSKLTRKNSTIFWKAGGFVLAQVVGWLTAVLGVTAVLFLAVDVLGIGQGINSGHMVTRLIGHTFWWSLIGAAHSVYRSASRSTNPKGGKQGVPQGNAPRLRSPVNTVNNAYAEALSEIEEGRLDKGVWARAFADAGGEAEKAKALYIKWRAEASKESAVWMDTEPPVANDNGIKVATAEQRTFKGPPPQNAPMSATVAFSLVGVVVIGGIVAALVLSANKDNSKQQTTGPEPVQAPVPQADWGRGDITVPPGNPFSETQAPDAKYAFRQPTLNC